MLFKLLPDALVELINYHYSFFSHKTNKTKSKKRVKSLESEIANNHNIEHYSISNTVLGKGGSSVVKVAVNQLTNETVAVKIINYSNFNQRQIERTWKEIEISKEISKTKFKSQFVKLRNVYDNTENQEIYIFMDQVKGRDLLSYCLDYKDIGGVPEKIAKNIFGQILKSVLLLHSEDICHRDLKLENIMIDDDNKVHIIDFGFANYTRKTNGETGEQFLQTDFFGTVQYASPEILSNIHYDGKKGDIWSLGIILYSMLTGSFPFGGENKALIKQRIRDPESCENLHFNDKLSICTVSLIKSMLKYDPKSRITVENALLHPWFYN